MFSKIIKYTDFDGNPREEEHLFHMSKQEILEWMMAEGEASMDQIFLRILRNSGRNKKAIMDTLKDLIYRSYGRKSDDGRRFMKTPEIKADFMETEAFDVLFMELISNEEEATKFMLGILPKDLQDEVANMKEEDLKDIPGLPEDIKTQILNKK